MEQSFLSREKELRHEFVCISRDLHKFANSVISPVCQRHGITMQQMYVLMELRIDPNQAIGRLSDRVGIHHTNFVQVCRKLESKGLVRRARNDADKRSYILSLTPEGENLYLALDKDITATHALWLEAESDETYRTIIQGMKALHAAIGRHNTSSGLE